MVLPLTVLIALGMVITLRPEPFVTLSLVLVGLVVLHTSETVRTTPDTPTTPPADTVPISIPSLTCTDEEEDEEEGGVGGAEEEREEADDGNEFC